MAKKMATRQNWYQYHKRNAGNERVHSSKAVADAEQYVRYFRGLLNDFDNRNRPDNSLMSKARRGFFGPSAQERLQEEQRQKIQAGLTEATKVLSETERAARHAGESSYADDWACRNADKIKH